MGVTPSTVQRQSSGKTTNVGSDEYKTTIRANHHDFICSTCARNNKHVNASIYCKLCKDYLCFKCLQWHSKYRGDHTDDMIGQDEMHLMGVQELPVMPSEKCTVHNGQIMNMFCQKDGIAGCQMCIDEEHRSCDSTTPRSGVHIEAANRQMKKSYRSSDSSNISTKDKKNSDKTMNDSADTDLVSKKKHNAVNITNDLQVGGEIKDSKQRQNKDSVDGSKKMMKQSITANASSKKDGQVLTARKQQFDLKCVRGSRDVNVRVQSDGRWCDIMDMCLLPDGKILMSDFFNKNLKLLDTDLNIIHYCDLPYGPRGLCMINKQEAVVAVHNYFQFVTIGDKIEMTESIELYHDCHGVAYSNGELYVSDGCSNIHVYTVEGLRLRTIKTCLNESPEFYLEWVTVSEDGSRIFMTKRDIICLDRLSGEVIWKEKDTGANWYDGLCVDKYSNALVCRMGKRDVVQFSPDGVITGEIINTSVGQQSPQSICIDEVNGRLIVGMRANGVIKVLE